MTEVPSNDSTPNLDPSADAVVSNAVSAIRDEIERAARVTAKDRGSQAVEALDVVAALQNLGLMRSEAMEQSYYASSRENTRSIRLAFSTALAATLTGVAGLAINLLSDSAGWVARADKLTTVVAVFAGVAVALAFGFAYSYSRSTRERKHQQYAFGNLKISDGAVQAEKFPQDLTFLELWGETERLIDQSLREAKVSTRERMPLGQMIPLYAKLIGLSDIEEQEIRNLLRIRNDIAHGVNRGVIDLKAETAAAANLLEKLRRKHPKKG